MCVTRSRGSIKSSTSPMPTVLWHLRISRKLQAIMASTSRKLRGTTWQLILKRKNKSRSPRRPYRRTHGAFHLSWPLPVSNLFFVDAFSVRVGDALNDLTLQPLLHMGADGAQARDAIDDVNCQIETVDLVENRELQRRVDASLLFVP